MPLSSECTHVTSNGWPAWFKNLRCPVCKSSLDRVDEAHLVCQESSCGRSFPLVNGRPVLINEDASVFRIEDFVQRRPTTFVRDNKMKSRINRLLPSASLNLKARKNYEKMERLLLQDQANPRVLIIGGGELGQGLDAIFENKKLEFIHSDVAFEPRTELICDCHDIPFADESFEAIVLQAVLEHVVDPFRCVAEAHRVLRPHGIIYVEVPFLQGVHMGRYDFMRFTDLGLRRLCRNFEELDRGAMCGTGMALSGMYLGFLKSLTSTPAVRQTLVALGRLTSFWLKYLDYITIDTPASSDAASGLYFLGRKSLNVLSDTDLLASYRGASSP